MTRDHPPERRHALTCMEIWSANTATEEMISVTGLDIWVTSRPHEAGTHGGDLHYVSMCAAGKICRFAVADVSGHGASVAGISATLRALMRRYINTPDQSRFCRELNEAFGREDLEGRFATAILATYWSPERQLILTNAGHPRPLWRHAKDGSWTILSHDTTLKSTSAANLPLGIIEPTEYHQFAIPLEQHDLVVLYTDALMEAKGPDGRLLGEDGLLNIARTLSAGIDPMTFGRALIDAVERFAGGPGTLNDDVTALVLHHSATPRRTQSVGSRVHTLARLLGIEKV